MKTVAQQRISSIRENSKYKLHISQEFGIYICLHIFVCTCIHIADTYLLLLFACVNEHKQRKKIYKTVLGRNVYISLTKKIKRRKKI